MSGMFKALDVCIGKKVEGLFVVSAHETARNEGIGSPLVPNDHDYLQGQTMHTYLMRP